MTTRAAMLPDFTRIIWHSAEARAVWGPRVARINTAWDAMERLAVVDGHRQACLTFRDPTAIAGEAQQAIRDGLVLIPLTMSVLTDQYSSTPQAVVAGRPFQFRVAFVRAESAAAWVAAWNNGQVNNVAVGELLGYPPCCRAFFQKVWVDAGGVDTSWQMGDNTEPREIREWEKGSERRVRDMPPEANILWRWMGVRMVPHLPCSFNCTATVEFARKFAEVGRKYGYAEEVAWMLEILDWPAEWSALHGVAEVRTPVLTVSTRTDATGKYRVVQRQSEAYPAEGAQGLRFPFRTTAPLVTVKPPFQRAFPVWERNGFGSEDAMDAAHAVVLEVLGEASPPRQMVLDLGCGSGRLLGRAGSQGFDGVGVEVDAGRADRPEATVRVGSLFDTALWPEAYDTIALMPGRLLESGVTPAMAAEVRRAVAERGQNLLLYAYGDWIAKESLEALAERAGFAVAGKVVRQRHDPNAAAMLVRLG